MKCDKCNNYVSDDLNDCFFCKVKKFKRIGIIGLIILLILLSPFGIPEFIRAIQGKDFVGIWFIYSLAVAVLGFITTIIFSKYFLNKHINDLTQIPYTINDLLFINDIKEFKYVAYCILKLKIDGIIKYDVISSENEDAQTTSIKLNNTYTTSELEAYQKDNCFIDPITRFIIKNSKSDKNITIRDIFENVKSSPDIFSKDFEIPESYNSLFPTYTIEKCSKYAEKSQKYRTIIALINTIIFWIIYSFALSKLIMGISFGKPVSMLLSALFVGLFGIVIVATLIFSYSESQLKKKWINKINTKSVTPYSREQFDAILSSEEILDEYKKDNILKTFIIADKKYLSSSETDLSFSGSLLNNMIAVELASKSANSSGGCSSCGGGCGGCGGGCGGCGD